MFKGNYLDFIHGKSMTKYLEANTEDGLLITDDNIFMLIEINDASLGYNLTTAIKISFDKKEDYYFWVQKKKNSTITHYTNDKQIAIDFKFKYMNNVFELLKNPKKVYFIQNEYSTKFEYEDVLSDGKYAWENSEKNIDLTKTQKEIIDNKLEKFNKNMIKKEIYKNKEYKDIKGMVL